MVNTSRQGGRLIAVDSLPDQNLSQCAAVLSIDKLHCPIQLNIHVRVHADESTLVFCLAPFQPDYDFFIYTREKDIVLACSKLGAVREGFH